MVESTDSVDVLIVTAVNDEWLAVRSVTADAVIAGAPWQKTYDSAGFELYRQSFTSARGGVLTVATGCAAAMGGIGISNVATRLVKELRPRCLAMCGVCAGNKAKGVALGDVLVAASVYDADEGKLVTVETADGAQQTQFLHDLTTFNLDSRWRRFAENMGTEWHRRLTIVRPIPLERQAMWLLIQAANAANGKGPPPTTHPDRSTACPQWPDAIARLWRDKQLRDGTLEPTKAGFKTVLREISTYPGGRPPQTPTATKVGALASVGQVIEDPLVFDRFSVLKRTTIGLEREGVGLKLVAEAEQVPKAIIAKGVQDFADGYKNDHFRKYAAHASAEFLIEFLRQHLEPEEDTLLSNLTPDDAEKGEPKSVIQFVQVTGEVTGQTNVGHVEHLTQHYGLAAEPRRTKTEDKNRDRHGRG